MITNWVLFKKADGRIGVLPVGIKPKGEVIEEFYGNDTDAFKLAERLEADGEDEQ